MRSNKCIGCSNKTGRFFNRVSVSCENTNQLKTILKYRFVDFVLHFPLVFAPCYLSIHYLYTYLAVYLPSIYRYISSCLFVCPSVDQIYLTIFVSLSLSLSLPIYLFVCSPVHLSTSLSICISFCPSISVSVHLPVYHSTDLPGFLSIYLSIYLSRCVSTFLSILCIW